MHGICLGETDPSSHRGDNHMCHISVYVQGCVPQGRPMCKKHRAQLHPELQSIIPTKNFQWDLKGIGAAAVQKWCLAVWIQCGGYVEHSGRLFASSHTSNVTFANWVTRGLDGDGGSNFERPKSGGLMERWGVVCTIVILAGCTPHC